MECVLCNQPTLQEPPNHCGIYDEGPCELNCRMAQTKQNFLEEMNDLKTEHQKLLQEINQVHNPISRHLPPEIISHIFQLCVPHISFDTEPYYNCDIDDVWGNIVPRINLGAVCRDWRHVALTTPRLWNFMLVNLDWVHLQRNIEVTQELLERSGTLPLLIRVYSYDPRTKLTSKVRSIINVINQQSSRWQMLDLRIPDKFISTFIGNSEGTGISPLRSLRIEPTEGHGDKVFGFRAMNVIYRPVDIFLTRVRHKAVAIQWDAVTWVQADQASLDECVDLFRNAPQIRHCRLTETSSSGSEPDFHSIPSHVIVHHQIEDLTVELPFWGFLDAFFSLVSFQSLKRLVIMDANEERAAELLASFFKRSSCRLEELVLKDTFFTSDSIISVLMEVPSLVELELLTEEDTPTGLNLSPEEFFKLLAKTSIATDGSINEEGTFLPHLQVLRFEALSSFSWDLLPPVRARLDFKIENDDVILSSMDHHGISYDLHISNDSVDTFLESSTK
ncbi:hypothetical protein CPB84DRAFT_1792980 [Gymnopilus junonius]|uniref:F-box domain-containing protein n=1 Tax=Gymnopilus junonius TaxID=109634 RepID=A0A9P5TH15_GYMJU|nr:hypothetical protein CPB84DRAFT_1792980 [Gymnopilus junonius]